MKTSSRFFLSSLTFATLSSSSFAANLVINGNFEAGLTGFTSDYTLVSSTPGSLLPASVYLVGPNPSLYHSGFASYGDHTTGTGNMLIANGSNDITDFVWRTTAAIPVTPNTDYYFEAWMSSAISTSPAVLSFQLAGDVSNATLGTGTAPTVTGVWQPVSHVWNSGANTSVTLFLQNANPAFGGNDFAIDDIHFGETSSVSPVPDAASTLVLASLSFAACAFARRRFCRA
jgi:hypothetical protein